MLPGGAAALRLARGIALVVPVALLGGAYMGQYLFGLFPCEMCWWQRYGHFAALGLALGALALPRQRAPLALAGLALLGTGLIGAFHAGVEYHWWQGITHCATTVSYGADPLESIMKAPNIRCDEAQWTLLGVSLAGYNFLISTAAALAVLTLIGRSGRVRA